MAKKNWLKNLLISTSLGLLLLTTTTSQANAYLVCASQFPLIYSKNSQGQAIGLYIDYLKLISLRTGDTFSYQFKPIKRCEMLLHKGEVHIMPGMSVSKKRQVYGVFSDSWFYNHPFYFYLKPRFPEGIRLSKPVQLHKQGSVCGVLGFNYSNFKLDIKKINTGANSLSALMKKLLAGRCDFVVARLQALYIVDKMDHSVSFFNHPQLRKRHLPGTKEGMGMLISKKTPAVTELINRLNIAIADITTKNKSSEILIKYFGTDFSEFSLP